MTDIEQSAQRVIDDANLRHRTEDPRHVDYSGCKHLIAALLAEAQRLYQPPLQVDHNADWRP